MAQLAIPEYNSTAYAEHFNFTFLEVFTGTIFAQDATTVSGNEYVLITSHVMHIVQVSSVDVPSFVDVDFGGMGISTNKR